jgi:adenylate cyclase
MTETKPMAILGGAQKRPCDCGKNKGATPPKSVLRAVRFATTADQFTQAVFPLIQDTGMQIATGVLDPVTALLVLRRRFGNVALEFEECKICKQDIEMAMEFDQFMINAKAARTEYLQRSRWRALVMFGKFQKNVLRACIKWVVGL